MRDIEEAAEAGALTAHAIGRIASHYNFQTV
jgi:hypothetical protein